MTALTTLSPELQMILLCARRELNACQAERLCSLAISGVDRERFMKLASVHGLNPLLYRNLRIHCRSLLPKSVTQQLHVASRTSIANTILVTAELQEDRGRNWRRTRSR